MFFIVNNFFKKKFNKLVRVSYYITISTLLAYLRGNLPRNLKLVLRYDFPLEMLSAVIRSERSYPAMPLARQLVHKRFIILGPLVQENGSLNFINALLVLTLEKDRIRTVSQRTKPNSRTAFIGEQPNPWKLLHLQDAMSRPDLLPFRLFILNF